MSYRPSDAAKLRQKSLGEFAGESTTSEAPQVPNRLRLVPGQNLREDLQAPTLNQGESSASSSDFARKFDQARRSGATRVQSSLRVVVPLDVMKEFLEEWLADGQYLQQSNLTLRGKKDNVSRLIWWMEQYEILHCSASDVKAFLHYVENAHKRPGGRWGGALGNQGARALRPVSSRTLQLYFVYIKGYFSFLASPEMSDMTGVRASPLEFVKQPKAEKTKIEPLTIPEIDACMLAAERGSSPKRDVALMYFLLDTGVRVSEIGAPVRENGELGRQNESYGLRFSNLNLKAGTAIVTGKGNKTRQVCFQRETRRALTAYLKAFPCAEDDFVFRSESGTTPREGLTSDGIRKMLDRVAEGAGLSRNRCAPHQWRRTFATKYLQLGGSLKSLQMLMGHEDSATTLEYIYLNDENLKNEHTRASPAILLTKVGRRR